MSRAKKKWQGMDSAPKDGRLIVLLVRFTEHSMDDSEEAVTIGPNHKDVNEIDEWLFAGWCWTHDRFTQGQGTPVGWAPFDYPEFPQ